MLSRSTKKSSALHKWCAKGVLERLGGAVKFYGYNLFCISKENKSNSIRNGFPTESQKR